MNDYQERVFYAAIKHERESSPGFRYKIWESKGYLILVPILTDNENIVYLGSVIVHNNKIWGINPLIISELEKLLDRNSTLDE